MDLNFKLKIMKIFLKNLIRSSGYNFSRYKKNLDFEYIIINQIRLCNITYIFDIGANTGQFSTELRSSGYNEKIISFEPIAEAHKIITEKSKMDKNWLIHPVCAIGENFQNIELNISNNSVSSSILDMSNLHVENAINSKYVRKQNVQMYTLDSILKNYAINDAKYMVKIDTQGYEWNVIEGGIETLKNADLILCEVSLVPLYVNQKLWLEVIDKICSLNFEIFNFNKVFSNINTGQILQIDILFKKSNNEM